MRFHVGFPIDRRKRGSEFCDSLHYLVYSGDWAEHSICLPYQPRTQWHPTRLTEGSGAQKIAVEALPSNQKRFLFVEHASSGSCLQSVATDSKKTNSAKQTGGDSDSLACALAWGAPEGYFDPNDHSAPIVLLSCALETVPFQGLNRAKLHRVASNDAEGAISLINKWRAVQNANKLGRGAALILHDEDATYLTSLLRSPVEIINLFGSKASLENRQFDIFRSDLEIQGYTACSLDGLSNVASFRSPLLISIGTEDILNVVEAFGLDSFRFDPSPFLLEDVLRLRKSVRSDRTNPGELLRADNELIPFYFPGRQKELDELDAWWKDESSAPIFLLTGEGGAGKTRLLYQWVAEQQKDGVLAGWLNPFTPEKQLDVLFKSDKQRVLIVVDYAENQAELLRELLLRLVAVLEKQGDKKYPPIPKVILLARNKGEWWDWIKQDAQFRRLRTEGDIIRPISDLLPTPEARRTFFHAAIKSFSDILGIPIDPSIDFIPDESIFAKPLPVLMAAYSALHGKQLSTEQALMDDMLDHEVRYLTNALASVDLAGTSQASVRRLLRPMVALFTLIGGVQDRDQAIHWLQSLSELFRQRYDLADNIATFLHSFYGSDNNGRYLRGLEPDILGEHLVAQVLHEQSLSLDLIFNGTEQAVWSNALIVLTRLANRCPDEQKWLEVALHHRLEFLVFPAMTVAIQNGEPLGMVLAQTTETEASLELAEAINSRCPARSMVLNQLSIAMMKKILTEKKWSIIDLRSVEEKATLTHNLAVKEREVGALEDALATSRETIDLSRYLDNMTLLSDSLNTSGLIRKDLGDKEGAINDFKEAIRLLEEMEWQPEANMRSRNLYLDNLCTNLFDLARYDEALQESKKALLYFESLKFIKELISVISSEILFPKLSDQDETIILHYANILNNRSNYFRAVGKYQEALESADRSCQVLRHLSNRCFDKYGFDYTRSLTTRGIALREMQEYSGLIQIQEEIVQTRRRLTLHYEEAYAPYLAGALDHLGMTYSEVDDNERAILYLSDAADIYRKYQKRRFKAIAPELAKTLDNAGLVYARLGRNEDAIKVILEAVTLHEALYNDDPTIFSEHLANSLHNLGLREYQLGNSHEAIAHTRQAVELYQTLKEPHHEPLLKTMAYTADNLARMLMETSQPDDAIEMAQRAENHFRKLTSWNRSRYAIELCQTLGNYALMLWQTGACEDALNKMKETTELLRSLNDYNATQRSQIMLFQILGNYANMLMQQGYVLESGALIAEKMELDMEIKRNN